MATLSVTSPGQVRDTAIEGRMRDLRHRQRQLLSLHQQLVRHEHAILSALQEDDGITDSEAKFVLASTFSELRTHYDGLDLKREPRAEYCVKFGESNPTNKRARQLAYITPEKFILLFSVLSTFAAATEAGTCCIFKLDNNLRLTPRLLVRILGQLYDKEAVCITTETPEQALLDYCYHVDQTGCVDLIKNIVNPAYGLPSSPASLCLGLVDRTADTRMAAKELVQARIAFGGKSPQAPDWILVNEFVAGEFINALMDEIKANDNEAQECNKVRDVKGRKELGERKMELKDLHIHGGCEVIYDGSECCSITKTSLGRKRNDFLGMKTRSRVLNLDIITSLDDAIDRLSNEKVELGALYVFAKHKEAKYLCQFITSRASFVNHVDPKFLIGPAAPLGHRISKDVRYSRSMFELDSPQFVSVKNKSLNIALAASNMLTETRRPLRPMDQLKGGAMGFFEAGIYVGIAVYLLPISIVSLSGLGLGLHYGYKLYYS